ncbi:hypothetical protein BN1708_020701, partial [Verticillium longisporum]
RPRVHLHRPLQERRQPLRRACRLIPRRLQQHPQAPPLLHRQAHLQRRHERHALPQGILRQARLRRGQGRL